ncbi:hypothetical protein GCM10010387_36670 [Streptomyces inusitatus]|uniref:Uncharacterized protein n=1 Tax=Streptomyces inusitatus TaxID=68221 RepID=A0A918UX26_9ACTN|nr:hypothetical protein GCM10010387_36670 [Streptomyces inusitatus]
MVAYLGAGWGPRGLATSSGEGLDGGAEGRADGVEVGGEGCPAVDECVGNDRPVAASADTVGQAHSAVRTAWNRSHQERSFCGTPAVTVPHELSRTSWRRADPLSQGGTAGFRGSRRGATAIGRRSARRKGRLAGKEIAC